MDQILLVLILLAGPSDRDLGDVLAKELRRRGGDTVHVQVGEPAHKLLEERWGITLTDLQTSRQMGAHLTRSEGNLVVISLAGRQMAGDTIIDAVMWTGGKIEPVSSIAGAGGDPVPALVSSLTQVLSERLPAAGGGDGPAADLSQLDVATLIKREAWTDAIASLAARDELSVREHYYRVLAYARIGQRDGAIESLNAMKAAHGQHFLVAAAEELIPALPSADNNLSTPDGDTVFDTVGETAEEPEEPADSVDESAE
ncbi:MAG: hypothetical protein PF961_22250 [Planctomycetota bacterium]|jgi:hypothetical protein|nr:hypothetical protein [Planctomycetota bacterium]